MSSSDEDAGDSLFGDFFVNTSYTSASLTFGDDESPAQRTLRLRVSTAACTDHDLTGQQTWPGARLLARFLAAQPDAFFRDCAACELGAGTGLAGLYYAARGGDVTLTDAHKVVMALLRSNEGVAAAAAAEAAEAAAAQQAPTPPLAGRVRVAKLPWGSARHGEAAMTAAGVAPRGFARLLGADILYPGSQHSLPGLMASVTQLLAPDGELLLCYCSRARTTDVALAEALAQAGLRACVAPGGEEQPEGGVHGRVFRITRGGRGPADVRLELS